MEEWPEWILEVLIYNYEMDEKTESNSVSLGDIEDIIHNFLIISLEHSMRQKDGWKDIEATIHCAEWLSIVGGSSTGDQRIRYYLYRVLFHDLISVIDSKNTPVSTFHLCLAELKFLFPGVLCKKSISAGTSQDALVIGEF
ncbi:hypothetical protein V6N13_004252 [Hibiscus sabdariffa]